MKIAVCDDSAQMREQVIDQIKNSEIMTENLEIIQFCAGKQILEQYAAGTRSEMVFMDGEMGEPNGIETVELELAKYDFYRVHQGYLVNLNHIEAILGLDIIMDNGDKVQIPVHKRTELIKTYTAYVKRVL